MNYYKFSSIIVYNCNETCWTFITMTCLTDTKSFTKFKLRICLTHTISPIVHEISSFTPVVLINPSINFSKHFSITLLRKRILNYKYLWEDHPLSNQYWNLPNDLMGNQAKTFFITIFISKVVERIVWNQYSHDQIV